MLPDTFAQTEMMLEILKQIDTQLGWLTFFVGVLAGCCFVKTLTD